MNTRTFHCTILLLITFVFSIQAQPLSSDLPEDSIISRIWKQNLMFPREKIYAMTDKSVYIPGDTIWFRNFLVDAATIKESSTSRYAYTELISPADTLIKRVKIAKDRNGIFCGYLPIPYQIHSGKYILRCYTQYSQNWKEKGMFSRPINILTKGERKATEIQPKSNKFHVGFYPEGGTLIAGQLCRIAFKAEAENGNDIGVHGWITDEQKDTVCHFQAIHQGMGDFSFIPKPRVHYFAECHTGQGEKKKFELPLAEEKACALKVERRKGNIYLSIAKGKGFPDGTMQLLAISRERPIYARTCEPDQCITFPDTLFKNGIIHFYLLKNQSIISKRSIFIAQHEKTNVHFSKKKDSFFKQYEKVDLELTLTGKDKKPLNGTAAVAITDAADLLPDSLQTIVSELLLSADLKGTIKDPAWYFRNNDIERESYALDILMRIHAWCRYDLPSILRTDYQTPAILPETSMVIKGNVTTRIRRKPIVQTPVNLYVKGYQNIKTTTTDENGFFYLDGFEYPDSTIYMLSTNRKNGKIDIVLNVDSINYPPLNGKYLQKANMQTANDNLISVQYVDKAIKNISTDGNIRNYLLGDITVTATKPRTFLTRYEIAADKVIKEEKIHQSGIQDLYSFILSSTGVDFFNFRGKINTNNEETLATDRALVLDDVKVDDMVTIKWILYGGMSKDDIQQIEILKGVKCIGFFGGKCHLIISITTKRGENGKGTDYTDTNFAYLMPLGLQKPKEFYSPHYEILKPKQPDLRTTIYWKPNVQFKNGKASVSFYTADTSSTYTVLMEGIADNEEPFRFENTIFNQ